MISICISSCPRAVRCSTDINRTRAARRQVRIDCGVGGASSEVTTAAGDMARLHRRPIDCLPRHREFLHQRTYGIQECDCPHQGDGDGDGFCTALDCAPSMCSMRDLLLSLIRPALSPGSILIATARRRWIWGRNRPFVRRRQSACDRARHSDLVNQRLEARHGQEQVTGFLVPIPNCGMSGQRKTGDREAISSVANLTNRIRAVDCELCNKFTGRENAPGFRRWMQHTAAIATKSSNGEVAR
jgi:hypothetical protein